MGFVGSAHYIRGQWQLLCQMILELGSSDMDAASLFRFCASLCPIQFLTCHLPEPDKLVQTGPTAHRPAAKLCHNGWHYNSPHAMSEAAIGVMPRTKLRRSCRPPIRATASWDKNTTLSASCASRLSQSSRHKQRLSSCAPVLPCILTHPPTLLDLRPVYL